MEDVHIDGDALVGGEEGKGFHIAMQSLNNGRLSIGATLRVVTAMMEADKVQVGSKSRSASL